MRNDDLHDIIEEENQTLSNRGSRCFESQKGNLTKELEEEGGVVEGDIKKKDRELGEQSSLIIKTDFLQNVKRSIRASRRRKELILGTDTPGTVGEDRVPVRRDHTLLYDDEEAQRSAARGGESSKRALTRTMRELRKALIMETEKSESNIGSGTAHRFFVNNTFGRRSSSAHSGSFDERPQRFEASPFAHKGVVQEEDICVCEVESFSM